MNVGRGLNSAATTMLESRWGKIESQMHSECVLLHLSQAPHTYELVRTEGSFPALANNILFLAFENGLVVKSATLAQIMGNSDLEGYFTGPWRDLLLEFDNGKISVNVEGKMDDKTVPHKILMPHEAGIQLRSVIS